MRQYNRFATMTTPKRSYLKDRAQAELKQTRPPVPSTDAYVEEKPLQEIRVGQTFKPGEDAKAIHSISPLYQEGAGPPKIPSEFLEGPPPNLTVEKVNFEPHIPEYKGLWAVVLDGVLSDEECEGLLAVAESTSHWKHALVNIGGGKQAYYSSARSCGRIMVDSRELAAKLWKRVEAAVPELLRLEDWASVTGFGPQKRREVWEVSRLNERMRFLKCVGGEYFRGKSISKGPREWR